MTSLEKLSNISPTSFNSSRFLYSIASHTRVLVSVLKTDQKVKRKISFQSSNERQLVKAKGFQAFQEQQLVQSAALRLEKYERPSAASPNAGSVARPRMVHKGHSRSNSGCCYLCEVDDFYFHSPYERKQTTDPLPDSRQITNPLPESRQITNPLPDSRCIEERHLTQSSSRPALKELDVNRRSLPPLRLKINQSDRKSFPAAQPKEINFNDTSFFFDDDPRPSPRKFSPGTKPQPFLLSPVAPPKTKTPRSARPRPRHSCLPIIPSSDFQRIQPPATIPRRKSSLQFRRPCIRPTLLCKLSFPLPPLKSPPKALTPFHLSTQEGYYLESLIRTANHDPLWTMLLQVSTVEPCIRHVCLKAGKIYLEMPELTLWLDPVARNIDSDAAMGILMRFLVRGGREMERMAGFLLQRLVADVKTWTGGCEMM